MPERLYHFTCAHARREIGTSNCLLVPHLHPWLGQKVLWLTTESAPDREKTGLTMRYQKCDRMQFRYIASDPALCRAWTTSYERGLLSSEQLAEFEDDGDPEHWWISSIPLRAHFDREWNSQLLGTEPKGVSRPSRGADGLQRQSLKTQAAVGNDVPTREGAVGTGPAASRDQS